MYKRLAGLGFPLFILAVYLSWIVLKKYGVDLKDITNAFGKKENQTKKDR